MFSGFTISVSKHDTEIYLSQLNVLNASNTLIGVGSEILKLRLLDAFVSELVLFTKPAKMLNIQPAS